MLLLRRGSPGTDGGGPGGRGRGAGAFICLRCTALAAAFFESRARKVLHFRRLARLACSFCGQRRRAVAAGAGPGAICGVCAEVAQEAVGIA